MILIIDDARSTTESLLVWLSLPDRPRLSRLSMTPAAAAAAGAAANVAGLGLVRDVLLGVLFVLWTAWWISLFVIYARQNKQLPPLSVVTLPPPRSLLCLRTFFGFGEAPT